jgi:hypothetical protein
MGQLKTKTEGKPRLCNARIDPARIITTGECPEKRLDYWLSVIRYAPGDYDRQIIS